MCTLTHFSVIFKGVSSISWATQKGGQIIRQCAWNVVDDRNYSTSALDGLILHIFAFHKC